MIQIIWVFMILVGIIFSIFAGTIGTINEVILSISYDTTMLFVKMASLLVLWSGILEIAEQGGFLAFITKKINWLIRPLFSKDIPEDILSLVSANLACNFIGLGSASTPFGLAAMKRMQERNPDPKRATKDMCTLIILNVCGLSILPTSLIALRKSYQAEQTIELIPMMLLLGIIVTVVLLMIDGVIKKWTN